MMGITLKEFQKYAAESMNRGLQNHTPERHMYPEEYKEYFGIFKEFEKLKAELAAKDAKLERYKKALEFYEQSWDYGECARKALKE